MRYYYLDEENKVVYIFNESQPNLGHKHLGSTNNPRYKMAVSAFLPNQSGYKIVMPPLVSSQSLD